ncbi:MAG: hypothetical protein DMG81_10355 [Acidobacteria bacterium]|nr:MAG: hypothetical protein DMG81_10355 [Acidobacteriota bacterium]
MALIRIELHWSARKDIVTKSDSGFLDQAEAHPAMIIDLERCGDRSRTPEAAFEAITMALRASGSATTSDTIQYCLAREC